VVEDDAGWQEVARYIHLNPVRVAGLGLNKRQQSAAREGAISRPGKDLVARRLATLPEYTEEPVRQGEIERPWD